MRGALSLVAVRISGTSNSSDELAQGSAAGGVLLTLSGSGFGDAPRDTTKVELLDGAGNLVAGCVVLGSSSRAGWLECRTQAASDPLAAAGTLCSVRVSALDASGGSVVATQTLSSAFLLVPPTGLSVSKT